MAQPHIAYLICATERSGSTLLCEALTNAGVAGVPDEYFVPAQQPFWQERWGVVTYEAYFAAVIQQGMTPNGVFGTKMMWNDFNRIPDEVQQLPDYKGKPLAVRDLLQDACPNLHYIWIRRRDKVRQAVSLAKAYQTDVWRVTTDRPAAPNLTKKLVFSFKWIDYIVRRLEVDEAAWQRYFVMNNIQPFVVMYEDFVLKYEETAIQILKYLGIPEAENVQFAATRMKKQADEETEQWVQRYHYLKMKSKYHRFISCANRVRIALLQVTQPGGLLARGVFKPAFKRVP